MAFVFHLGNCELNCTLSILDRIEASSAYADALSVHISAELACKVSQCRANIFIGGTEAVDRNGLLHHCQILLSARAVGIGKSVALRHRQEAVRRDSVRSEIVGGHTAQADDSRFCHAVAAGMFNVRCARTGTAAVSKRG